ncbi:MAG: carbohydrate kinase family protein [Anaerolineae bacterium]|jgi:pseudouridine kinase|nr:carbohydrate kinase family protein [Anaerolineae bacterium]
MDEGYVLVIGSAGIDIKGRPDSPLQPGQPNPGRVRNSVGGVARNIAENLARLEMPVVLLTALGDDTGGLRVLDECRAAGIDCDSVQIIPESRTGTYLAFLRQNGELDVALTDFEVMQHLDSAWLRDHAGLFAEAALVVLDATLSDEALATVFDLAARYGVRVCADPTTPSLAGKLCPYIDRLYLITPNAGETSALCGLPRAATDLDTAIAAARGLVALGAAIAVVTMGELGLAYADRSGGGFIRALKTRVLDATGAGDALTAAIIFGLLNDVDLDEAMRLGVTAAALTLQSRDTVLHSLSQELLYDKLLV